MQLDLEYWINALRAGIGLVPPTLIAAVLLGGPTAAWLLYRFVVQPRNMRIRALRSSAMWVCPNCRSVNELLMISCYRCDEIPIDEELELIDARPAGPVRLTAVGPGLDLDAPAVAGTSLISRIERAEDVWADEETSQVTAEHDRAALPDLAAMTEVVEARNGRWSVRPPGPIAVGPARPTVTRPAVAPPRRAIVAGPAQDPDDTPAA